MNQPIEEFEWPCDLRIAHHAHQEVVTVSVHGCDGSEDNCQQTCPVPEQQVLDCPGVGAHPFTMIGGAYRPSTETRKP